MSISILKLDEITDLAFCKIFCKRCSRNKQSKGLTQSEHQRIGSDGTVCKDKYQFNLKKNKQKTKLKVLEKTTRLIKTHIR